MTLVQLQQQQELQPQEPPMNKHVAGLRPTHRVQSDPITEREEEREEKALLRMAGAAIVLTIASVLVSYWIVRDTPAPASAPSEQSTSSYHQPAPL